VVRQQQADTPTAGTAVLKSSGRGKWLEMLSTINEVPKRNSRGDVEHVKLAYTRLFVD